MHHRTAPAPARLNGSQPQQMRVVAHVAESGSHPSPAIKHRLPNMLKVSTKAKKKEGREKIERSVINHAKPDEYRHIVLDLLLRSSGLRTRYHALYPRLSK